MSVETSHKVTASQLNRSAFLYVRQSTPRQVLEHTESTARQYALRKRAVVLGWQDDQVITIDSDLGQSGASSADREGFRKLVMEVSMGRAGIVLGLEVSRLARNSTDWHRLLEICAITDTLILDEDGIYHPGDFNDRLLLGLNRPETQSTSYSTFCWTTSFGSVDLFRTGTPAQTVPSADIPDVLTGEAPAKSAAQAGTIERHGDFCVGAPWHHFVNPGNRFFWRFQRAFSRCGPLYVEASYRARTPTNLHLDLPRLAAAIHLHGFDRHPQ
jgi:hypothetical protein